MAITEAQTIQNEIVLQERVVSTEFIIRNIRESIEDRRVEVQIELGPFITEERPNGRTETRGSGRRGVTAWEGDAYDAIRDTWTNADLLAAVKAALEA